ncbi:putative transmembrane efflux protein [Patulibacter medicamentivorans]|uniref:Putative transmembrane efflux protein n=1 Tax=Patulibacter medicamentivorans TaxID=1097667 RepID=H0EA53_9ACTN|nr:MFS transporter [Patulibacter medicamentivorans]EHN09393.1 putative transmembrane efflux protein [Patulibacter medicamentivorans]
MPATQDPHHARRWLILAVIGIAQLMVVLDATIVNIALPSAQHDLGFSDDSRQWVVTAYALAFGSLLLLGGRLGDLIGRKRIFIVGLLGFALASAVGGAAGSFGVLVAARAAQGLFGALLAPAALGLLSTTFTDPDERGKAFGVFGAIAGSGAAIGMLLGGVLTEWLSWRWSLYVNLLFAVPAAIAAFRLLHEQTPAERPRLDIPGTVAASAGLFSLVYGFSHAETDGWGNGGTIAFLAAGVALLAGFVLIELRSKHPLLPMRVVLDRSRGASYLAFGLASVAMFGVFLFLTYYLQQTLGFSPIETGLAFLPISAAIMVTATTVSTKVFPRTGARPLVPTGMLLGAAGMIYFTGLGTDSSYAAHVLPGLLVMGVGMGLIFAPAMATATLGVDRSDAGVASAMVNTAQQVGGSVGTALLSTLAASATTSFAEGRARTPQVMAEAAVHGYTTAFWWSAGIFLVGAIVTGTLLRGGAPAIDPAVEPAMAH